MLFGSSRLVSFTLLNLISIISSLRIDCEYFAIKKLVSICKVSDLAVSSTNETVTGVSGTLPGIVDYANITSLDIDSSPELEFLPSGIEKFFPNLEKIAIVETGLRAITSDDLKEFPKLKSLILRNNKLSEIDSNLFEFNQHVEHIDLSGNELKFIGTNVLKPLANLKKINISNNQCANETASDPSEIKKLKVRLNENCRHPQHEISAFKSSASFVALCLLAILLSVLLVRCIKFVINK